MNRQFETGAACGLDGRAVRWIGPLIAACVAWAAVGCGGGDGGGDDGATDASTDGGADGAGGSDGIDSAWPSLPATPIDEAVQLDVAAVETAASGGCLASAQGDVSGTAVAAGRTSAGDVEGLWVAYDQGSSRAAAVQICTGSDCSCASVTFTDKGATVSGDIGAIGAPVLAKELSAAGLDSPTELRQKSGGLESAPSNLDPTLFRGKRRLVVANAFGPVFGTDFGDLIADAAADGRFSEAYEHSYVQAGHMDRYLNEFHSLDVLVWFGGSVQRGVGSPKPEGMTVNRGLLGDETYDRERIETQLMPAPLGGPGLLVLAGAESFGTAADGLPVGGVANLVDSASVRQRAVVGFRGWVTARESMRATRIFLLELLGGKSLAVALTAANAELDALGAEGDMLTQLTDAQAQVWMMAPSFDDYFGGSGPESAELVLNFLPGTSTQCVPPGGGAPVFPPSQRAQFFADVTFDGPFFSGTKAAGDQNFEVFGVVAGLYQGGALNVFVTGDAGFVTGGTILGDGHFCREGECSGKVSPAVAFGAIGERLYFTGSAQAAPFVYSGGNVDGYTCDVFDAALAATGDDPSWLQL